jgi:hypothetical protein
MATTYPWYGVATAALMVVGTGLAINLGLSAPDVSPVSTPAAETVMPVLVDEFHGHGHPHHRGSERV